MITSLKENEIFVFGSNLAGQHIGGAAKQAHEQFGAEMGVGEGMTGQCYAFPTLGKNFEKLPFHMFLRSVRKLYNRCLDYPMHNFLLTPVGTGIAGYAVSEIAPMFKNHPRNLVMPEEFEEFNSISTKIMIEKVSETYKVSDGTYTIGVDKNLTKKTPRITLRTFHGEQEFVFRNSKPEAVEAIGKLLIESSKI